MGCRLWGRTESDTTEATQQQQHSHYIIPVRKLNPYFCFYWAFSLYLTLYMLLMHSLPVPSSSDSYYSELLLNIISLSNDIPFFQSWSSIFLVSFFYLSKRALQSVCIGYQCISPPDVKFSKSNGSVIVQQFVILKK